MPDWTDLSQVMRYCSMLNMRATRSDDVCIVVKYFGRRNYNITHDSRAQELIDSGQAYLPRR